MKNEIIGNIVATYRKQIQVDMKTENLFRVFQVADKFRKCM